MTITFKYKTVKRPDGSTVKTPSIPVTLKGKEQFDTIALIDSGADISAIPLDIAQILGLNLDADKSVAYGIGGKVDSIETKMNITVEKGHEHYSFFIPVKVILGKFDFPPLIGRLGFFNKFIISFDQERKRVSLKKITRG